MAKKFSTPDEFLTKKEEVSVNDYVVPEGYQLKPLPMSERVNVLLTKRHKEQLKALAKRRDKSMNALINEIIIAYLEENA